MEPAAHNDDTPQRSRSRNGTRSTPVPGSPPCAASRPGLSIFLLLSPPSTSASTHTLNDLLARPLLRVLPSHRPGQNAQDK